jgi:hypothetical protein
MPRALRLISMVLGFLLGSVLFGAISRIVMAVRVVRCEDPEPTHKARLLAASIGRAMNCQPCAQLIGLLGVAILGYWFVRRRDLGKSPMPPSPGGGR